MKRESTFKGRDTIRTILEKVEMSFGRLNRDIGVMVEENRPVFETDGIISRGPPQIDVVLFRTRGKLSFTAEEARRMITLLGEVVGEAERANAAIRQTRKAWQERQRTKGSKQRFIPKPVKDFSMGKGKTARKKKAKAEKAKNGATSAP